jgi:hypothetical protein
MSPAINEIKFFIQKSFGSYQGQSCDGILHIPSKFNERPHTHKQENDMCKNMLGSCKAKIEWIKTTKMYGKTLLWLDKNKTIRC